HSPHPFRRRLDRRREGASGHTFPVVRGDEHSPARLLGRVVSEPSLVLRVRHGVAPDCVAAERLWWVAGVVSLYRFPPPALSCPDKCRTAAPGHWHGRP